MGRRTAEKAKIICPPPSGVDIILSFGNARAQYEHLKQHEALHLKMNKCLLSLLGQGSRPAAVPVTLLHSNCHLYGCWPLAGREEY